MEWNGIGSSNEKIRGLMVYGKLRWMQFVDVVGGWVLR